MYKPIQKYLHLEISALLFLSYCIPLILGKFFEVDVKGVNEVLESVVSAEIIFLYLTSFVSFYLPSLLLNRGQTWKTIVVDIPTGILVIMNLFILVLFIFSKFYVYKYVAVEGYAFDTGAMNDPTWTFSMFLSEVIVLMSVMWLALGVNKYFWLNILILQLNLLHGTRIYMMIAIIFLFGIVIRKLPKIKIITFSFLAFVFLVASSYIMFLIRHDVLDSDLNFDLQWMFSPVLIESIFSQWSLINILSNDLYFSKTEIGSFLIDPLIFSLPRILFPDKENWLLYLDPKLSPLGAFNGIAASIIYFGYFYPIYWIIWGSVSALLCRAAISNYWARVIYLIFCFNILLRLMRDGYLLPVKILLDDIAIIVLFLVLFKIIKFPKKIRLNSC
jgi:hypothetical protein